jgi:hypothetical protein
MKQKPIVGGKLISFFVLFCLDFFLILLPPPALILEFEDMFNTLMTASTN